MSTAVSILILLALVSTVGTVIVQSGSEVFYQARYGEFWSKVIFALSLDSVYSAWWFLGLAGFLVVSVSICLLRNGPHLLRQLNTPKKPISLAQLRQWPLAVEVNSNKTSVDKLLSKQGFSEVKTYSNATYWHKGKWGRMGYFFTHISVVVLSIGALLTGVGGYRLSLHLVEGQAYNTAALWQNGRFTAIDLPFTISNKEILVEHYFTGKPSQFTTHLEVTTPDGKTTEQTIAVNKPITIMGQRLYQADYGDGGSDVSFKLRQIKTSIFPDAVFSGQTGYSQNLFLDYKELRSYALIPDKMAPQTIITEQDKTNNLGLSVEIQIHSPTQSPTKIQIFKDSPWVIGVYSGDDEGFNPVFIGLDPTKEQGWSLVGKLLDNLNPATNLTPNELQVELMSKVKDLAITELSHLSEEERLRVGLGAIMAASFLYQTGLPFIPIITDAKFKPYSGIIIAHDPGFYWFLLGSILLIVGISMMLYLPFVRVWVYVNNKNQVTFVAAHANKVGVLPKIKKLDSNT